MEHSMEEYEGYDEYEDDGQMDEEEEEEEYLEVEDRKPTKKELEYLEFRQRLKEQIRKQTRKDDGSHLESNARKKLPYDNFGSFFGPSQPVISQRVIEESKSILENQHLSSRVSDCANGNKTTQGSNGAVLKPRAPPKVINEKKSKVEKLKDTRDYSFLFSEDAHVPGPTKDSTRVFAPNTEARSAHAPMKCKQPPCNPRQNNIHVGLKDKISVPMNGQMQSKNKSVSSGNLNLSMMKAKKQLSNSINGNGLGRPQGNGNNRNGPGRSMVAPKALSAPMQKKPSLLVAKNSVPGVRKPLPSKKLDNKRNEIRPPPAKAQAARNRPVSSSEPQMSKAPPQRQVLSRPALNGQPPKKRPARSYSDDEDDEALSLIRKMTGYNPGRYSRDDDDDSDMEATFEDIMMEENRSAKIARKEDEEQLRLIQEEEERERRRARLKRIKRAA